MTAAASAGGLGMSDRQGGAVYGLYTAAAYLSCLPGGWIADRLLGQRKSVFWGGVLIISAISPWPCPPARVCFIWACC